MTTEQSQPQSVEIISINLPDIEDMVDALGSIEGRQTIITRWLESYVTQLGGMAFSVQRFMAAAQTRLAELHSDDVFELGAPEYDQLKDWVFEALASGTLSQSFDDTNNRIQLQAAEK